MTKRQYLLHPGSSALRIHVANMDNMAKLGGQQQKSPMFSGIPAFHAPPSALHLHVANMANMANLIQCVGFASHSWRRHR